MPQLFRKMAGNKPLNARKSVSKWSEIDDFFEL